MAETLGSLCDKLTIVKLKQWHTDDSARLASLDRQAHQLCAEIDEFVHRASNGEIAPNAGYVEFILATSRPNA